MKNFEQTTLADLSLVRHLTNTLGEGTKKSFGQNFLVNQKSLLRFVDLIDIQEDEVVIEIGPGIGVVSYTLAQKAKEVYLIEIDKTKELALQKTLSKFSNIHMIWDDATSIHWHALFHEIRTKHPETPIKIIGSLPYNVGKKIIYNFFVSEVEWSEAAFFLQREVAQNYTSQPPTAEFLAIFGALYAEINLAFQVPPDHFYPRPAVTTGVVHLVRSTQYEYLDRIKVGQFIKQGFMQPRKTLLNNLKNADISKEDILSVGLKETVRPSELDLEKWIELYKVKEMKTG